MTFSLFEPFPALRYGLSERKDGTMKLGVLESKANRRHFFAGRGIIKLAAAEICHGTDVREIFSASEDGAVKGMDGLLTREPDLFLSVTVADCFPVLFYNPKAQVAGIAHAGWRGIINGIIKELVAKIGANPADLLCGVGPGIQKHHFEIKKDVADFFVGYSQFLDWSSFGVFADLPGIIRRQLLDIGLNSANIEIDDACTYCLKDKYFSFRRDKPPVVEAMAAFIGFGKL